MKTNFKSPGFTLIELLVVISVIGFLASIILVSLNSARAKARDARIIADFKQINNALDLFYDKNNRMPNNYNPGFGACNGGGYFEQSMQELVNDGFISRVPVPPPGGNEYCYYNYGNAYPGALLVTDLESVPDTTTGIPPSCRPWGAGVNWCDQTSNKYYCICHTY
ncbi:MAG: hypothetical protein A2751_05465 [Candidatus Doudnabacteria bacterium RIFCSPHIGHO2_01_FULL_46_14]|uniref:Type II secretion system protein GspG C-terminal domain-containing protein n=1 Tax=Candidatus Doudnabacteria bacterium RIFCSPHIGHO2_01_FULL_46_14 TaxID=1817824 RepID=A0A1F5NNV9_9BACT|nr:MAG: hypothetical protein A2751_05465 [Candidatus Doudnabacteria bacterium RIFCSPHIGHO2_01_FULL_46_14]